MRRNSGKIRNLHVEGIPASLFYQFKMDVLKKKKTMKEAVIFLMEAYVNTDNPGDDSKKKIDNPGDDLRSPEEILADKIIEGRKVQEDLKKLEKEIIDESLEVNIVEKMDEIQPEKEPEKEPEIEVHEVKKMSEIQTTKKPVENPEIEPVDESIEENPGPEIEPEIEPAAEKNPGPESEPVIEENPGPSKLDKILSKILPPWF
ncbi:hypothetical protein ES703_79755 [subsurface metagenome]